MCRKPPVESVRTDIPPSFMKTWEEAGKPGPLRIRQDDEVAEHLVPSGKVAELRGSALTFQWTGRDKLVVTGVDTRLSLRRYRPRPFRTPRDPTGGGAGGNAGNGEGGGRGGRGGRGAGRGQQRTLNFDGAIAGVAEPKAPQPAAPAPTAPLPPPTDVAFGAEMAALVDDEIQEWNPEEAFNDALAGANLEPEDAEALADVLDDAEELGDADAAEEAEQEDSAALAGDTTEPDQQSCQPSRDHLNVWTTFASKIPTGTYWGKRGLMWKRPGREADVYLGRTEPLGAYSFKVRCHKHTSARGTSDPCQIWICAAGVPPVEVDRVIKNWLIAAHEPGAVPCLAPRPWKVETVEGHTQLWDSLVHGARERYAELQGRRNGSSASSH